MSSSTDSSNTSSHNRDVAGDGRLASTERKLDSETITGSEHAASGHSPARQATDAARRENRVGSEAAGDTANGKTTEDHVEFDGSRSLDAAALIRRHQRAVWRYLRMLGCDEATADDLTQETFLRVLRKDDFVQHNDSATAGYLRRTAYNLLVSRHRKLGRVQTIAETEMLDESWDRWAGKDLSGDAAVESLQHCFKKLTERAQIALRMRFGSNASRVEIGEALGITDHGARNLMQRAKQQLRNCVEERMQLVD
jgi:RNA polymerase sigma-70 factor (ECF subfamily)